MLGRNKNVLKLCTPARDKIIRDKNMRFRLNVNWLYYPRKIEKKMGAV